MYSPLVAFVTTVNARSKIRSEIEFCTNNKNETNKLATYCHADLK